MDEEIFSNSYNTPRPRMQINDAFVRLLIFRFRSIIAGRQAKTKSVRMFIPELEKLRPSNVGVG
jgi:hypothetical protein